MRKMADRTLACGKRKTMKVTWGRDRGGVVARCSLSPHNGEVKEERRLRARPTNA